MCLVLNPNLRLSSPLLVVANDNKEDDEDDDDR